MILLPLEPFRDDRWRMGIRCAIDVGECYDVIWVTSCSDGEMFVDGWLPNSRDAEENTLININSKRWFGIGEFLANGAAWEVVNQFETRHRGERVRIDVVTVVKRRLAVRVGGGGR